MRELLREARRCTDYGATSGSRSAWRHERRSTREGRAFAGLDRERPPREARAAARRRDRALPALLRRPRQDRRRSSPRTIPSSSGRGSRLRSATGSMGRVTGQRGHGKTIFLDIRDLTGSIQAYARLDALGEEAFARIDDARHRRHRRRRWRSLRDQTRAAGDGGARVHDAGARRCATRPTSSTASPTQRSAIASASST